MKEPAFPEPEATALTRLRHHFYAEAGVRLGEGKVDFLRWRLASRLRDLGLSSYAAYALRVESDAEERKRMVESLLIHETSFFREPAQFTYLEQHVFPRWREDPLRTRHKHVRAWSAACATGQEPYSVAMSLLAHFPPEEGWHVEVLATDLSTQALACAEAAVWPREKSREIPADHLRRFMLRGTGPEEGRMRAGPLLRSVVRFQPLNLQSLDVSGLGPFDLIFCRNALIYFDAGTAEHVVQGLLRHLSAEGLLLLGHAETLRGMACRMRGVHPSVYVRDPVREER